MHLLHLNEIFVLRTQFKHCCPLEMVYSLALASKTLLRHLQGAYYTISLICFLFSCSFFFHILENL